MEKAIPIFVIIFFTFVGALSVKIFEMGIKKYKVKNEICEERSESDFMLLGNGFKVTSTKHPTVAQQWVNIMNYTGENQTEVDYEDRAETYTAENLG